MHGLLLLSHGSRDPRAAAVIDELVQAVSRRSGLHVRACHLDFTEPTPDVALRQMAEAGFTSARVLPLLFTPGYHVTHDVPESVEASGVTGLLELTVAPTLVGDEPRTRALLLGALGDRLAEAHHGDPDAIVLASAGSGSARARAAAEGMAHQLGAAHGVPAVAAFASAAAPSPAEALRSLRDAGARNPVVASLFVAPGRLRDSVVRSADGVPVAEPLGAAPRFVDLLLLRAGVDVDVESVTVPHG
jgi:sirohydrochlorin ferrochelatase